MRTLLEHAWANTLHDRLYKVAIQVPPPLLRDAAGLAASVEAADRQLDALRTGIDRYLGNYTASLSPKKIEEEIQIAIAAREFETDPADRAAIGLRIGGLLNAAGRPADALAEWQVAAAVPGPHQAAAKLEWGTALCFLTGEAVDSPAFQQGQALLREVATPPDQPAVPELPAATGRRAEATHRLAESHRLLRQPAADKTASELYRRALGLDPDNPYFLASFLEDEVYQTRNHDFILAMRRTLEEAIATCRDHIAVSIEVLRAHFTIGRLHLLLADYKPAYRAYVKGLDLVLQPGFPHAGAAMANELTRLERMDAGKTSCVAYQPVRLLLALATAVHQRRAGQQPDLAALASPGAKAFAARPGPVLIIAGGADGMAANKADHYKPIIQNALAEFDGILVSGGTEAGIPGLVGRVSGEQQRVGRSRNGETSLIGYAPRDRPAHVAISPAYEIFATPGADFTELEPIQCWIDLLHAGRAPEDVSVLGINGGPIAAFEYRLALALGARVGVVEKSGRQADALTKDPHWHDHPRLLRLPETILDRATLRSFVRPGRREFAAGQLDELARLVHEKYLGSTPYSEIDPVRRKFADLRADLQESNRDVVRYAAEILESQGYAIRPHDGEGPVPLPEFTAAEIESMAELEHGRWNIERLAAGWRYAPGPKNVEKRLNPCLVPWDDLTDGPNGVKQYDRQNIEELPALLARAGMVVIKRADG